MTSIAIIGAGAGLGAAVARRFGAEGLTVGLISRHQGHLDALAGELANDGIQAKGFTADVRDPSSIGKALEQVSETLSPIEVLQYSPLPQGSREEPDVLAGHLWDLHTKRDRFRHQVSAD